MLKSIRIRFGFALGLFFTAAWSQADAQVAFGGGNAGIGNGFAGQSAFGTGAVGTGAFGTGVVGQGLGGVGNQGSLSGLGQGFGGGGALGFQPAPFVQPQTVTNLGGLSNLIRRQTIRRNGYVGTSMRRGRR